jgi:hypothetical protein
VRVLEIFASLQGEGVNLGKPAVFIRLAVPSVAYTATRNTPGISKAAWIWGLRKSSPKPPRWG